MTYTPQNTLFFDLHSIDSKRKIGEILTNLYLSVNQALINQVSKPIVLPFKTIVLAFKRACFEPQNRLC